MAYSQIKSPKDHKINEHTLPLAAIQEYAGAIQMLLVARTNKHGRLQDKATSNNPPHEFQITDSNLLKIYGDVKK